MLKSVQQYFSMLLLSVFCLLMMGIFQSSESARIINYPVATKTFNHFYWNETLTKNVTADGKIYFDRIKAYPKYLNQYLDQLAAVSPDSHPHKFETAEDKLAYWINAYHALQMKLVMEKYPINSAAEVQDILDRQSYYLGGQLYSAHGVYQRIQDEYLGYPQIWFALSDFTVLSPALLNRAYTGSGIKDVLTDRARVFLNDETRVQLAWDNPPVGVPTEQPVDDTGAVDNTICERVLTLPQSFQMAVPSIENFTILSQPEPDVSALKGNLHLFNFFKEYFNPNLYNQLSSACAVKIKYRPMDPTLAKYF